MNKCVNKFIQVTVTLNSVLNFGEKRNYGLSYKYGNFLKF